MREPLGDGSIVGQFFEKCKQRRERLNTERTEIEHREHGEEHSEESLCYGAAERLSPLPSSGQAGSRRYLPVFTEIAHLRVAATRGGCTWRECRWLVLVPWRSG